MLINSIEKPDIIELEKNEKITVSSTYEMIKTTYEYDPHKYKSIKVKVYNNFFVVVFTDIKGKTSDLALSDTWDFCIR